MGTGLKGSEIKPALSTPRLERGHTKNQSKICSRAELGKRLRPGTAAFWM